MKAGLIITGTGPILILTSLDSIEDPRLAGQLYQKGIKKFIAYEVPIHMVKERYGARFDLNLRDSGQCNALRVIDYDGNNVFNRFKLRELKQLVVHEFI